MTNANGSLQEFTTAQGARIFQLPLLVFPGLWGYAYLVWVTDPTLGELRVLVDAGSGFGQSNEHLEAGRAAVAQRLGQPFEWRDLTHILITHGHIDHYGGLNYILPRTSASLGIHELDRRILTHHEERVTVVARRLGEYLVDAGVSPEARRRMLDAYLINKVLFTSMPVNFTYEAVGMRLGPFEMFHVPGHCAGHVVIRLHEVLFSGDHILAGISPHQAPERLTLSTGLEHYLTSLRRLSAWRRDIHLVLPGHKQVITHLRQRIREIRSLHQVRLQEVLNLLAEPHTISQISKTMFGDVMGYNVLLALEETGAHVEYLYQRGQIEIANLAEMEAAREPIPLLYHRIHSG